MTNDAWDDDRLDAAYAARGEVHPTPGDLTATTIACDPARVRGQAVEPLAASPGGRGCGRGRCRRSGRRRSWVAMVGPGAPTPSDAAGRSHRLARRIRVVLLVAPTQVAGLTVISVSDAIASATPASTAASSPSVAGMRCPRRAHRVDPAPSPASPIQLTCADHVHVADASDPRCSSRIWGSPGSGGQPTGPAVHPAFDLECGSSRFRRRRRRARA